MSKNPKLVSFHRSPAYVHHRAMLNRRENNIVDALELMRRAVEGSPENREYRLDLAELYCEMGCHEQSSRLLLDMLADEGAPAECYYGLALNQLGMNDVSGARRSLRLYRRRDPAGAHSEEVSQLTAELDFYSEMNRPASRRLHRAAHAADRACEALKSDMPEKACRLFERSLALASEQFEMRALYAMALMLRGDAGAARREAEKAASGYPPSVHALCVCAQVYALLGEADTARTLIARAAAERPEGNELRLMIYAMGELDLHDQVAEYARLALQASPFDRGLLHARAVALKRTGAPDARLGRFWARILRIDPEDSVAQFYQEAAANNALDGYALDYGYQVPAEEYGRRLGALVGHLAGGFDHVRETWTADAGFRQLVRWSVGVEDARLSRAAMTVLATVDTPESRSILRELLFTAEVPEALKLHAAMLLKLQGPALERLLPAQAELAEGVLPDAETVLARMPVGDRQLVRFTDEVLEREYGASSLLTLGLMWSAYRAMRGTRADPLRAIEAAAAALAYNYQLAYGPRPRAAALAKAFHCAPRQMVYYARRIAACLEKMEDSTEDEDS